MPDSSHLPVLPVETHRALAAGLFNRTWDLLATPQRTPELDDELIHTAHASAWHWLQAGNAANRARAEWLCARVYATLGRAATALEHARRCVAYVDAGGDGFEDWDAAAAAEGMARALALAGDVEGSRAWVTRAWTALAGIAEPEERAIVEADLASIPT